MRARHARIGMLSAALGLGLVASACGASRQYFEPTARVQGETLQGYKQAFYPLHGPSGRFGEAVLWSRGAYRTDDGRTVIQVAFQLHNTSAAALVLRGSEVRIDSVRASGEVLPELLPAERADVTVGPQAIGETQFHFVVPSGFDPGDLRAFRLHWAVSEGDARYEQRTTFAEMSFHHPAYPAYPYDRYPCWPYGPYDCSYGPPPYLDPFPPAYLGGPRYPYPQGRSDHTVVRPHK